VTALQLGRFLFLGQHSAQIIGDVLAEELEDVVLVGGRVVVDAAAESEGYDAGYAGA